VNQYRRNFSDNIQSDAMSEIEDLDKFFSLTEDHDVDFAGHSADSQVPVLSYSWAKNAAIADATLGQLIQAGSEVMEDMGLKHIVRDGTHLRGDTGEQRMKMTVLKCGKRSMFIVMTAGLPGTRMKTKELTRKFCHDVTLLAGD